MDWTNIDLNNDYERNQPLLDEYTSDTFLLEVSCNLPIKNEETLRAQFNTSIQSNINSAKEIFENNLQNYLKYIEEERKNDNE